MAVTGASSRPFTPPAEPAPLPRTPKVTHAPEPFASEDQMEIVRRRHPRKLPLAPSAKQTAKTATPTPYAQQTGQSAPVKPHVPVVQRYEAERSVADKIADVVTAVATMPFRLIADAIAVICRALTKLAPRNPVIGALLGLIAGVARAPQGIVGTAAVFLRNVINGRWLHSPAEAINLLAQPVAGSLAVAAQALLGLVKGADDAVHPPRPLAAQEKRTLSADYPAADLDRVVVHDGDTSWVYKITGFAADAQTLQTDIYLRGGNTPPQDGETMRHELVHTLQYRDMGGLAAFLGDYFGQMLGLAVTGKAYYADIRQEEQAYALQD